MRITGVNFLGGKESAQGEQTFQCYNPKHECHLDEVFVEATSKEVSEAVASAAEVAPYFAQTSVQQRAKLLETIGVLLEEHRTLLVGRFCLESALPEARAHTELTRTIAQLTCFSSRILSDSSSASFGSMSVSPDGFAKYRLPVGPVVVFGASNFPFAYSTVGGDTASALAVGCPVIVKGHPYHAGTGELVARLVYQALDLCCLRRELFSHLNAARFAVGEQLVKDPRVKAIGFTGSFRGGMALLSYAQEREEPVPVFAEMGSVNPSVILPMYAEEHAGEVAQKLAASMSLHSGQYCTSPGVVFVPLSVLSRFEHALVAELTENGMVEKMIHPNLARNFHAARKEVSSLAGAQVVFSRFGAAPSDGGQQVVRVTAADFGCEPRYWQEVFGSFLLIVSYGTPEELLACLDGLPGQLTGSLWSDDHDAMELRSRVLGLFAQRVGRIILNGVPTGVQVRAEMHHGGPFPASSDSRFTAVGGDAIDRFSRFVTLQISE